MVFVPATVLGGLPVIAEVWFSQGDGWSSDDDAGVDALYWRRRDGTRGAPLSERVMARVEKNQHWEAYVTEQANDWLGQSCPVRIRDGLGWRTEGEYTEEYLKLNRRK